MSEADATGLPKVARLAFSDQLLRHQSFDLRAASRLRRFLVHPRSIPARALGDWVAANA
ncbi:hypothetical protein ROV95_13555 [Stenotrophomonas maltophilia group sp. msm1]|uniref:hypothetical protein n=1 Tax=Stenotrophomonas maltophilia group sp. msm1 TaxID=3061099 RepID=UPI0028954519|nr:hypothetical protein [Stenotrophomonas maltophilia group sp. msm1]MDT3557137.1 hypothetical protein [Stenotrophomonas maltophilia group sp. msm1]